MKPLIKWAGGKSSEIKYIQDKIPRDYDRYFEPMIGGGAIYFYLEPEKAVINDTAEELIQFYRLLKDENHRVRFEDELIKYVECWERVEEYIECFENSLTSLYNNYKKDKFDDEKLAKRVERLFEKKIIRFDDMFSKRFCVDRENFLIALRKRLIAKLQRTKKKVDSKNNFSNEEIKKNVEAAFKGGFYTHFRDVMNMVNKSKVSISKEKRIANYYFIREFCYGGMFRFNQDGEFNVPYGGIQYNKKDFRGKVERIFSDEVKDLLKRTTIRNLDFEKLLEEIPPAENDFVFIDPPYDTEFSEYEEKPFSRKDHKRLAKSVKDLDSRFILVIQDTPLIRKLYNEERDGLQIESFDKTYTFNIRGRHDRKVNHLIIHNLENSYLSPVKFN